MKRFVKGLLQNPGAASLALFTREIWANPRAMGAACPSAPSLASYMASRVPLDRDGLVVELGGGTGAVTAALLKHGVLPWKLVVIERSPTLAHHLRRRFPQLRIVQGDAVQLEQLLDHDRSRGIGSIVSSLPLRSLHPATTRAIGQQFETLLEPGGLLIQYTYDLRGTHSRLLPHFHPLSARVVWGNLPPARVEVFERK
ncbi:MAG: methyltransferase domain-containing protein [Gammaproteobacteria bacterium]|nr:methyltransferase domain-containing protein [Gammaproteobacteria bacterium]MCP5196529.1 methyltransferase domain-containing protein [Gammaproteobacteria bacterium]